MARKKKGSTGEGGGRSHRLKWLISALCLAAIAVATAGAAVTIQQQAAEAQATREAALVARALPVKVSLPVAESGYEVERSFTGLIAARRSIDLGFDQSGRVSTVLADLGDRVSPGEVVAELDRDRLMARQAEFRASVAEARAALTLAEADLERAARLAASGASSTVTRDQARTTRDQAAARLSSAEAALESVMIDLDRTELRSPFDAIVVARLAEPGAIVSPGTAVLRLLDAVSPEAEVGLPLTKARQLFSGRKIMLRLRQAELEGTVRAVVPEVAGGTRTATVVVALPAGTEATEGETVELVVTDSIEADGYWVPTAALMPGVRGLWSLRTVVGDPETGQDRVAEAAVTIEHIGDGRAFVRGSLDAETPVIIDGAHRVAPGQAVAIEEVGNGERS